MNSDVQKTNMMLKEFVFDRKLSFRNLKIKADTSVHVAET